MVAKAYRALQTAGMDFGMRFNWEELDR
jgi:hypothetical protein